MINLYRAYIPLFSVILFIIACSTPDKKKAINHVTKFAEVESNLKLEILDWGGKGLPILFLTGLGDNAHIYDEFAPQFTNHFHVYALTRRGYGMSGQPSSGYDINILAKDILSIIDFLKINKVILIGHSIAGEEITKFASTYPDRVVKIIYLDAAYDRTSLISIASKCPSPFVPVAKDSASLQSWKQFQQRANNLSYIPDDAIANGCVFSKEGKYLRNVTDDTISLQIVKGVEHPTYKRIVCPALAIYAVFDSASHLFPDYENYDPINKRAADTCFAQFRKWSSDESNRFQKEVANGTVKKIIGANHYVFISNPTEAANMIREFLCK